MTGADNQAWWEVDIDHTRPVADWTLEQCSAYVEGSDEHYGEAYAEAGSGAMSLGYGTDGAYAAANAVAQPSSDPLYVEARRRVDAAWREAMEASRAAELDQRGAEDPDDIPF
jgi:hypothetical protein